MEWLMEISMAAAVMAVLFGKRNVDRLTHDDCVYRLIGGKWRKVEL